jgi:tetratricopeptide (TPR) repeat protein
VSKRVRIALFLTFAGAVLCAQELRTRLNGKIEPARDSQALDVELRDTMGHGVIKRIPVSGDGTFSFDVPTGSYDVRLVTAIHNDMITEEYVQLTPVAGTLVLRIPQRETPQPVSGTISVKELQARVPKKAFTAFVKAQRYSEMAKPSEAIEELQKAIAVYPGWRDAHANLGVQLLKTGRTDEALTEFREAIRIGPPNAMLYTNLGAGLATARHLAEGESAVRQALRLDPTDQKAEYLLGHLLAAQPGREKEALENLRRSDGTVAAAKVIEAQVLLRTGDPAGAAGLLHDYLKSPDAGYRKQAEELLRITREIEERHK